MNEILELARWRFFLMRRQRLVLASMGLGFLGLFISLAVASASYLWPHKVYWDFALGLFFVFVIFLGSFVASHLFGDERQRRTLHLLLASGVSRRAWLWANFLGLWSASAAMLLLWSVLAWALSLMIPVDSSVSGILVLQTQLALVFESMIVLSMAMSFSLFLRPVLALLLTLTLTIFLHSQVSLVAVLTDSQTGAFNKPMLQPLLQWLVPLLPPLEWYDLRVLVGYESAIPWAQMFALLVMSLLWTLFWIELGLWKFRKTDL